MPLPIAGMIAGIVGRVLSSQAIRGVGGFAAGMLGRAALGGGTTGAAGRLGLAGMVMARGRMVQQTAQFVGLDKLSKAAQQMAKAGASQSRMMRSREEEVGLPFRSRSLPSGVAGVLARDVTKVAGGLVNLPQRIKDWTDALVDSQQHLRRYNGVIAAAYQRFEKDEIARSMESGRATAGTTQAMLEAISQLNDELRPLRDGITNLGNMTATIFVQAIPLLKDMVKFIPMLGPGLDGLIKALEELGEQQQPQSRTDWQQLLRDFGVRGRERRRPPLD